MKVWIIGRWGMVAQALQRKCREKGIDYIATTRREVDVASKEALKAQFETLSFTHVINCAGYTAVDQAEDEEEKAYLLNAEAVKHLAELAKAHGKKLIHFSTDYVFNGEKKAYGVDDPITPLSVYGKSKGAGEETLRAHYPSACLIRTSWLFGREGNHFVKTMVELMKTEDVLKVVSDQKGRPTYADDLAEAALTLLDKSGTYHFANQGETTWHRFAETIRNKLKEKNYLVKCREVAETTTEEFGAKAKRPLSSVLKTEHFSPAHWEEGLEEVLDHVLNT